MKISDKRIEQLIEMYCRIHPRGEVLAALRELQSYRSQWVSVKDRLPEVDGDVLVWIEYASSDGRYADCANFENGAFWLYGDKSEFVSHWMPLPAPPSTEVSRDQ